MSMNQSGGGTYRLQASIGTSNTTISLSSFLEPISKTPYTMTMLGDIGYATIDPLSPSRSEFISFTGITQNSDGTATLTGVTRGLERSTPYTANAATFAQSHSGQAIFILSNSPNFLAEFAKKRSDEAITGFYTVPTPVSPTGIATKDYVDQHVSGGTISINRVAIAATAGATVVAGNIVYLDTATNRWKLADSATAATLNNVLLGVAQGSGTNGNAISGGVVVNGEDSNQSGLTPGSIYYASTVGGISTSAGATERAIGIARSATVLDFNPDFYYVPTALQKAALAGNLGTLSPTNRFVTETYISANTLPTILDQSQGTQDSAVTVGEASATTKHFLIAQKFTAGRASIKGVRFWKAADTGTYTGTVKISLQADSSGSPSGSDLASYTITNAAWLKLTAANEIEVAFSSEYNSQTVGSSYWIVFTCSTGDNANHPNLGANSAGGYAGALKYFNAIDSWVLIATTMLYFKTLNGVVSKIAESDTDGILVKPIRSSEYFDSSNLSASTSGTGEVVLYSKLVKGGYFSLNGGLKMRLIHQLTNPTINSYNMVYKVKYNGSTMATFTDSFAGGSTSGFRYKDMTIVVLNQASLSSQAFTVNGWFIQQNNSGGTITNSIAMNDNYSGTGTVDTSGPGLLEISGTSNNASQTMTLYSVFIEKITA